MTHRTGLAPTVLCLALAVPGTAGTADEETSPGLEVLWDHATGG